MHKLFLTVALVGLVSCSPVKHTTSLNTKHITRKVERVVHTSDHRYAYRDETGIWWWYFVGPNYYTNTETRSGGTWSINAGTWTRGAAPTAEEEEGATTEEISMEVEAEGEPATATEVEAEGGDAAAGEGGGDAGGGGGGDAGGGGGGDGGGGGGGD